MKQIIEVRREYVEVYYVDSEKEMELDTLNLHNGLYTYADDAMVTKRIIVDEFPKVVESKGISVDGNTLVEVDGKIFGDCRWDLVMETRYE